MLSNSDLPTCTEVELPVEVEVEGDGEEEGGMTVSLKGGTKASWGYYKCW